MSHRLQYMYIYLPLRASCCFSCTIFNEPKRKAKDKVSCVKRQRKVMMFGEKIELLERSARGENVAPVRVAITGSTIVGRTFPVVLFLIPKHSLSFKPHSQTFIFLQTSFPNLHFLTPVLEPPFQNP